MEVTLTLVGLALTILVVGSICRRYEISEPLALIAAGIALSYVSFVPEVELTPEIVLLGLLPPLLYSSAIRTSLYDLKTLKRPIGLLSVGLVIFTTVGVGLLVWWVLPVPLAVGFALGAVVAPPDAVAASAVARSVGMPRRVVTLLEGESLINDATAIVSLRTAIAAIAGSVSIVQIAGGFVVSALGGALVGWLVAKVVIAARCRLSDPQAEVALSLLTPFAAYVAAEEISVPGIKAHPSGVLAVVVAGLLISHAAPTFTGARARLVERTTWQTVAFVLENAVFLLIGLQLSTIVADVGESELGAGTIAAACVVSLLGVIVLRLVWTFATTYGARLVPRLRREEEVPWQIPLVVGWAGMRGVVTLAAVFLLPEDTPHRPVLVFVAFVVTAGTLVLQGLSLPWLVRRLGLSGPDRHEDHLQEAEVYQAAATAGLAHLDEHVVGMVPDDVLARLRARTLDRANSVWERLGGAETPTAQYSRARAAMLQREREAVLRIRDEGSVDQTVLRRVLDALDVEESMLDRLAEDESTADRESDLTATRTGAPCGHLADATDIPVPLTPSGCAACLEAGTTWVHLRLCLACGYVGCCDSSPGQHASAHFGASRHPVMRSFEPGEAWRWCFVDELTG